MDKHSSSIMTPGNGSSGGGSRRAAPPEPVVDLAAHQPRPSAPRRVLASAQRALAAWRRVRRLRRAVRELSSIGIYRLGDVGIPPGQIPEIAEALLDRSLAAETVTAFAAPPGPARPPAEHRGAA